MTPCQVNFLECGKRQCDKGCWTCKHYIPGRGSIYYTCGLRPIGTPCIDPWKECGKCIWRQPDHRTTKKDHLTYKEQDEYKKNYNKKWRKRKKEYQTKYKRFYRAKKKRKAREKERAEYLKKHPNVKL